MAGLPERLEGDAGRAHRRDHRSGHGRHRDARRQIALNVASAAPTALSPFFIPMGIANMASGQTAISFGAAAPTSPRSAPAPPAATPSARRARSIIRGDADMMIAGGTEARDLRGARRRRSRRCAPCRRATTTRRRATRPVRRGPRRLRHRRGRRRARPRGAGARRRRAARGSSPSSSATARPPTRRTSRCPRRAARRGARRAPRAREGRHRPVRDRPRQRARHLHAGRRPGRAAGLKTLFGDHAAQIVRSPRPRA